MANVDNPMGFLPHRNNDGSGGQPKISDLTLADANSIIGRGDPLTYSSGRVDRAAAGNVICGIAAEPASASKGTDQIIKVWADQDQEFVAQTDNGTGTLTAIAGLDLNADFVIVNATNNQSNAELDESSGATTASLPFRVVGLSKEYQGNALNAFGEFNRLIVKINNHRSKGGTGTVGT